MILFLTTVILYTSLSISVPYFIRLWYSIVEACGDGEEVEDVELVA